MFVIVSSKPTFLKLLGNKLLLINEREIRESQQKCYYTEFGTQSKEVIAYCILVPCPAGRPIRQIQT